MPADEIAGLSVVVSAEVAQAIKALEGMSKQFEETSLVAQQATDIQEASFVDVETGMDNNLKQHEKHSEGVMGSLKKIGMVWTAITGAAIGGIYGLLRASSYGSLYFSQWGAIMKDVANTAIRPILPLLNTFTNAFKTLAEEFKKVSGEENVLVGFFAAISLGISELWDWIGDLDLKWQILIGVFAAVVLAGVSLVLIFTGTFGIAIAIGVVIAAIWTFRDEIGWLIDKLVGAAGAAKDFVDKGLKYIVTYLSDLTWPTISNPFDLDYLSGIADWVLSVLGLKSGHAWIISWPTISNPFAGITWCSIIPGWVASVLGICGDTAVAPVITWPSIDNPFTGIFDPITDFAGSAATYGGNLISNLVSGINAGMPSLTDAVSGITGALTGIGDVVSDWVLTEGRDLTPEELSFDGGGGDGTYPDGWDSSDSRGGSGYEEGDFADPDFAGFATGGPVSQTGMALVHEGEYVIPKSGTLIKNDTTAPAITIAPILNLTVNNGTQKDSRALADEISRLLSTEIRRLVKT